MSRFGDNELNTAQLQAVHHDGGPLLLLAGAGSGKTRVITYRLAELLRRGADPERILAVTFTNKAAGELRGRTEKLVEETFGPADRDNDLPWPLRPRRPRTPRWIGTFHSIGARLLRRLAARAGLPSDFVILDDDDTLKLCKQLCEEFKLDELAMPPRALRAAIDRAKNQCILPAAYRGHDYFGDLVGKLYKRYQERLIELGAADFGDLLLWPVVLCETDPEVRVALGTRFQHVLVDEFQDVNTVQYRLLLYLAERSRNLVVVGDDDQAIYGWRGADVRILLDFERDWPDASVIKLEENYRSSQVILDAAHAVVTRNPDRRDKRLFTRREGGELILCHQAHDERAEASFVVQALLYLQADQGYEPGDFAIIYRTNAQSRVLEEALRAIDQPYTVVGGMRFYDRAEVKDILAYLRLCSNPADELALRRVINKPARGIGETTIAKLEAHARLGGISLWQAVQAALHDDKLFTAGPRRKLQTFVDLIEQLHEQASRKSLTELAKQVVSRSGYLHMLRPDEPEDESRLENVQELLGSIEEQEREAAELVAQFAADHGEPGDPGESGAPAARPELSAAEATLQLLFEDEAPRPLTLTDYLARVALQSGDDSAGGPRGIQLMTAHAAKGLEFKVVFITGLEDGLFPSLRQGSMESEEAMALRLAEERRLAYVALTRARERLVLTYAYSRRLYGGQPRIADTSRFIGEIPAELMQRSGIAAAPNYGAESSSYSNEWSGYASRGAGRSLPSSRFTRPAEKVVDDGELRVERDDTSGFVPGTSAASADDAAAAMFSRGRRRPAPAPARGPQRIGDVITNLLGHRHAAGRPSAAPGHDGLHVEYDEGGSGGFTIGHAVRHRQFGIGRIEAVSPQHGGALLTIRFPSGECKTIKSSYVEPVSERDLDQAPGD